MSVKVKLSENDRSMLEILRALRRLQWTRDRKDALVAALILCDEDDLALLLMQAVRRSEVRS